MVDSTTVMQSGRYKAYPEYKDSGIEWLGEIPSGWKVLPIKYVANVNMGQSPSSDDVNDSGVGLPFLQGNADFSKFSPKARTWCPVPRKIAEKGDVLFSVRAPVGAVNVADMDYGIGRGLCSIKGNDLLAQNFLAWLLPSYKYQFDAISTGSTFESVSSEEVNNLLFSLPSLNEQKKIASFLDYETAKIDTLIEKQQRLIELLTEKRQAVISHAVTKGLNPDVPMKDSGVEWLGEVPEHWEVSKFSHCAQIRNGLVSPRDLRYKQLVLYAPNHIEKATGKILYKETAEEQGADSSKYLCFKGEVLYSKIRPALAKVALCEEEIALCSADMYPISAINVNGLTNEFLYYFMLSDNFTKAAILDSDRVAMPKINRESLSDYKIAVPSINEQKVICEYISTKIGRFDILEKKAQQAIQLMQERRTALISSAVTGKIDVRDWVKPE